MTARINAMRTKQSAYFPSSIESSVGDDQVLETNKKHQDRLSHVTILSSGGISFPYNASVLWNRETVSFPKQLISQNTISPLLLCPNDIAFVLQCIQSNKSIASGNLLVSATQYHHLSENQKYMIGCPVLGIPRYMFSSDGNTGDHLTIPITNIQDNKMLLFEESSTLNLLQNLGKSIRSGREFSLKSCMRIRAAGSASQTSSSCKHSIDASQNGALVTHTLSGTVRMEAILPNISFQAVQLNSIPILATPLAKHLTNSTASTAGDAPKIGYLTLNQVRKLVLLQETDTSVSLVPLVGLWVKFGIQYFDEEIAATLLEHPFVWGACVRFLCSDQIHERVHVAQNTFLLVLMVGDAIEYYEVSKVSGGADTSSPCCLSKASDFLCTDFTADLSVSLTEDGSPVQREGEAVICRFRPLIRTEQRRHSPPLRRGLGSTASVLTSKALAMAPAPPTVTAVPSTTKQLLLHSEPSSIESGSQLAPRPCCPQPISVQAPVSPPKSALSAAPSAGEDSLRLSPQQLFAELFHSQQGQDVLRLSGGFNTENATRSTAVVDLVQAQQKQILDLRGQVEELRQMVLQLGGRLPVEHFLQGSTVHKNDAEELRGSLALRASHTSHTSHASWAATTSEHHAPLSASAELEGRAYIGSVEGKHRGLSSEVPSGLSASSSVDVPAAAIHGQTGVSRLVKLNQPIAFGQEGGGEGERERDGPAEPEQCYGEDFELDEVDEEHSSEELDSPNSAESDGEESTNAHPASQYQNRESTSTTTDAPTPATSSSSRRINLGPETPQKSQLYQSGAGYKENEEQRISGQEQCTKSCNTVTLSHNLGIGVAEMDSICVGASYSGTSSSGTGLPRSVLGPTSKWSSASSGHGGVKKPSFTSRQSKLLDHEEDHPALMESESILQIQARYI